jgi:dynein heavy chain 1
MNFYFKTLLAERRNELIRLVIEGAELVWDSYKLENYTQRFQDCVFAFQEKVDDLMQLDDTISREIKQLATCPFNLKSFSEILASIQKSVDEMANHLYSNLQIWVNGLDQIIEEILAKRLEEALTVWADCLQGIISFEVLKRENIFGEGILSCFFLI